MKIQSKFMTGLVSRIVKKVLRAKLGYEVDIQLNEFRTTVIDDKLKELYGEDAHKKIMESIAAEKSSMPPITATGGFSNSSLEFEDANEEQRLFYDSFSKRYFQATISQVLQAEYHINRNMVLGAFVTLNDFYDFLGISHVEGGDVVGWLLSDSMYWIDFDNSKAMVDDGLNGEIPCYVVDAEFGPQPESAWDY